MKYVHQAGINRFALTPGLTGLRVLDARQERERTGQRPILKKYLPSSGKVCYNADVVFETTLKGFEKYDALSGRTYGRLCYQLLFHSGPEP